MNSDNVIISKYKNDFAKVYTPNSSEEVFVIEKVKNSVAWGYIICDLNREENVGTFYKNEFQKTNEEDFRTEKVIKRVGDKLYVKCRGYNNSLNSWIDKKDGINKCQSIFSRTKVFRRESESWVRFT